MLCGHGLAFSVVGAAPLCFQIRPVLAPISSVQLLELSIPHPFSFLPQRPQWWLRALATIWVKLSCSFSRLFHHSNQWSQTNTLFKMSDTWNVFCFPDTVTFFIQRQWPRRSSGLIVYILKGEIALRKWNDI